MISHPVLPAKAYVLVWLALIALLLLTLGSAYLRLGWANGAINIAIAVIKALLVMIFLMHLRSGHYLLRISRKHVGRVRGTSYYVTVGSIAVKTWFEVLVEYTTDNFFLALECEAIACPIFRVDTRSA